MTGVFTPIAIFTGVVATFGIVGYVFWDRVLAATGAASERLRDHLDRTGIDWKPEELMTSSIAIAAILWFAIAAIARAPLLFDVVLFPVAVAAVLGIVYVWVAWRRHARSSEFNAQLELALRVMASGLRVGLGIRQALNQVVDEMPDPAKYEFARVIGQTNLGVSVHDAMDDLAARMPSNETLMMARALRVQSQTGGDLATVLEHLSNTIRDRRRLVRKAAAVTSEGRMSAIVLEAIPPVLAIFIVVTQPEMGHALLQTTIGHIVIVILAALEIGGFFWLRQMLRLAV